MIRLYADSTMESEGGHALMRWSHDKEVAMFYVDLNEDAKADATAHNLNTLPILVDIGHKQDDESGNLSCTQLAVGVNAILAYTF
jgi:hypothetical protein